jgi:hypothetical protein
VSNAGRYGNLAFVCLARDSRWAIGSQGPRTTGVMLVHVSGAQRIAPYESKSIAEAAAHHSCQMHPVFENLPPRARLVLLARCDGHWKQVLYFMECLLCMPGRSAPAGALSNVSAGFFSLEFLAILAPFLGLSFSGASVCGVEL